MGYNYYKSAGDIINQVAVEIGLQNVTDPYSSQDPAFVQLKYLLRTCGDELLDEYDWQSAIREWTFLLDQGNAPPITMPPDFYRLVPQTSYDLGTAPTGLPVLGPASAQEWNYARAVSTDGNLLNHRLLFRIKGDEINILDLEEKLKGDGASVQFRIEYISTDWAGEKPTKPGKQYPEQSGDIVFYRPQVIQTLLKLRFLAGRGFDTTAANNLYLQALEAAKSQEKSAPILNAGDRQDPRTMNRPLDNYWNSPDSGYGG